MSGRACECGCGEWVQAVRWRDRRFVAGHQRRSGPSQYVEEDRGYDSCCWVWQWSKSRGGYGRLWAGGRQRYAHVVYYERHVGPVPRGLSLDHLCRVRACVNPAHLEPVTGVENSRRGSATKLTQGLADEIRELTQAGWLLGDVAAAYGVGRTTAFGIREGTRWAT